MQPNIITVNNADYRVYTDENSVNFPAAPIQQFALRRVFSLQVGTPKIVDFIDLPEFWAFDSVYISSPDDSEITVEILNADGVTFFSKKFLRQETPKTMPTALITSDLTLKLTAGRSAIALVLIYLKPAHLAYSKDF